VKPVHGCCHQGAHDDVQWVQGVEQHIGKFPGGAGKDDNHRDDDATGGAQAVKGAW
jgi:hypothetical protein